MKIIDVLSCDSAIKSLDFTADHRYLIICSASSVICWDTLCLLVTWRIQQSGIGIHVSPNGCFAFDGPQVMRFEPETGRVLSTVQFSANVDELLVVKYNNEANIFVAKTKKVREIFCKKFFFENFFWIISKFLKDTDFSGNFRFFFLISSKLILSWKFRIFSKFNNTFFLKKLCSQIL